MWLTGLLGYPLGHTLSPAMHQAAFAYANLQGIYVPFEVPPIRLHAALEGLQALGVRGCNLTIPHKQAVLRYVESRSPAVQQIGAANTLSWGPHGWTAHNTDVEGFLAAWHAEVSRPIERGRFILVGSGGAARALLYGLLEGGAEHVTVMARQPDRIVRDLGRGRASAQPLTPLTSDLLDGVTGVLNATPVGMHGHAPESPVAFEGDASHLVAWDAIYNPAQTPFIQAAQARGALAYNGLRMLAGQARLAFQLWTGQDVPLEVFLEAIPH